ncbi:ATPase AAA, partial [Mycobacterium nebraskense]
TALRSVLGRDDRAATITAAAADEDQLPDQVADLRRYHRTVTARLRREHRIDRHAAHDQSAQRRAHASDRALVEVLAAAHRHGDPLPLAGSHPHPVNVATTAPYVVAALSAEHYTPETAEAIKAAATAAGRNHAVIGATPHPGRPTLKQLAAFLSGDHDTHRGPVVVVEDAAAADPKALAAVATAVVSHHGRLLLIDSGEPGTGRRLLDGLALPWSENARPTPDIADPALAAVADRHRGLAAHRWRIFSTPLRSRDRGRERDRDYGLDID